ncbi:MAG: hypothetical protein ACNYPH_06760 [Gammaproteobacteria bacterium WSBS_2016_MAG_OTU1]
MFELLYLTLYAAVYSIKHSFNYAAPFLVLAFAIAATYLYFPDAVSSYTWLMLTAFLLPLLVLYILTTSHAMLHPEDPPVFWRVFQWRVQHWDFLIFVLVLLLVLSFLIVIIGDTVLLLIDYIWFLEGEDQESQINVQITEKYGYERSNILILLLGSRVLTAALFILAMLLWFYFFRSLIKIPAHVENYNLSSEEAMSLTRPEKWKIMAVSLFINIGLLILFSFMAWDELTLWIRALSAVGWLWLLLHVNLAFAVVLYQKYTEGYSMRRLLH